MQVKLSYYKLNSYGREEIKPGIHVCPTNGCTSVGTIVDVGPVEKTLYSYGLPCPKWVKVLWGTGKKKGKITEHTCDGLVNADRYLASIEKSRTEIVDLIEEAKGYGL